MNQPTTARRVSRSEQVYRACLWVYPHAFRRTYGREMLQTFRDYHRDVTRREGIVGHIRLWTIVLQDLLSTACVEQGKAWSSFLKHVLRLAPKEYALMSLLTLDVAARTDIGRTRAVNEDNVASVVPQDAKTMSEQGALFIVTDGLGGSKHGDVASELAVKTIREVYYQDTSDTISTTLRRAVEQANTEIYQSNKAKFQEKFEEALQQDAFMGTTCVVVVLKDNAVYIANVGDSLVYLIRNGQMRQIAENHSWVAEQIRMGTMTQEEAEAQGKSNLITRCLGSESTVQVYTGTEQVQDKDILVLCTDGLHTQVSENEIRTIAEQYGSEESTQRLIERANENGGVDNVTAIVVRVSLSV